MLLLSLSPKGILQTFFAGLKPTGSQQVNLFLLFELTVPLFPNIYFIFLFLNLQNINTSDGDRQDDRVHDEKSPVPERRE